MERTASPREVVRVPIRQVGLTDLSQGCPGSQGQSPLPEHFLDSFHRYHHYHFPIILSQDSRQPGFLYLSQPPGARCPSISLEPRQAERVPDRLLGSCWGLGEVGRAQFALISRVDDGEGWPCAWPSLHRYHPPSPGTLQCGPTTSRVPAGPFTHSCTWGRIFSCWAL